MSAAKDQHLSPDPASLHICPAVQAIHISRTCPYLLGQCIQAPSQDLLSLITQVAARLHLQLLGPVLKKLSGSKSMFPVSVLISLTLITCSSSDHSFLTPEGSLNPSAPFQGGDLASFLPFSCPILGVPEPKSHPGG